MSRKRFFGVFFGIVGAVVLAIVLYLAFGDLGRHKARIEALVTPQCGAALRHRWSVQCEVDAGRRGERRTRSAGQHAGWLAAADGRVRQGGREDRFLVADLRARPMFDCSNCMTRRCCWSTALTARATGSWVPPAEDDEEEPEAEEEGQAQVPVVIRIAQLNNVRLIYREAEEARSCAPARSAEHHPGQGRTARARGCRERSMTIPCR